MARGHLKRCYQENIRGLGQGFPESSVSRSMEKGSGGPGTKQRSVEIDEYMVLTP